MSPTPHTDVACDGPFCHLTPLGLIIVKSFIFSTLNSAPHLLLGFFYPYAFIFPWSGGETVRYGEEEMESPSLSFGGHF